MDKKTLNNEVILCRGAVRKAKVAVIRKILKKMKILKACKIEAVKDKKLKKCERLFEKVQMMKRLKVDEVTKFALRNKDLEPFLNGPKRDLRENSLACLAQHDAVMKKINSIRQRIPNWEVELPRMLDSLGKKNRKKYEKFDNKKESIKTSSKIGENDDKVVKKGGERRTTEKVKGNEVSGDKKAKSGESIRNKHSTDNDGSETNEESDGSIAESLSHSSEKVDKMEKIDDPFFIGKKVVAPKLVLESPLSGPSGNKIQKLRKPGVKRDQFNSLPFQKPFKTKSAPNVYDEPEEERLHPSWAAKKVKLIKPFQGKKITFSDD